MKKFAITLLFGLMVLVGGLGLLISIVRARESSIVNLPAVAAQTPVLPPSPTRIEGKPVKLEIPSLKLNLAIIPGTYDAKTQTWTLTKDKVQYAAMTPPPNTEMGNTFLYGHYRSNVFASLHKIPADGEAIVTTDNGHTFYYKLANTKVVKPTDSAGIFDYQGKPILTIQTCTGAFFQNRQLFTFDLERVV
jgi:LPXTG-site transpeptidase (sortase) family protein